MRNIRWIVNKLNEKQASKRKRRKKRIEIEGAKDIRKEESQIEWYGAVYEACLCLFTSL